MTKQAQFDLASVTTGTTRVYTVPNANATLAALGPAQTFTAAQTFSAGTNSFGTSTSASTANIATGATTTGNIKALNTGTAGLSGSTTNIAIGSARLDAQTAARAPSYASVAAARDRILKKLDDIEEFLRSAHLPRHPQMCHRAGTRSGSELDVPNNPHLRPANRRWILVRKHNSLKIERNKWP